MIRLTRGSEPAVLQQNKEAWTREFVDHTGPRSEMSPTKRYRYRHPDIKAAVKRDSAEKCIYCESLITHVHPGEIEHLEPSSQVPERIVDWGNLGFVCTECNREKLDYHDPDLPLLNPFTDEPSDHLAFYGPMVLYRPGADRGEITVRKLKLNDRMGLLERRKERISNSSSCLTG